MAAMLARLRDKNLHTWLGGYLHHRLERVMTPKIAGLRHLLFAFCDHYEPLWGQAPSEVGEARVGVWEQAYPHLVDGFRDGDGLSPRHSFFFPGDQYEPRLLDRLTALTRAGHGEVELHLHHEGDTRTSLREKLVTALDKIGSHGHFSRDGGGRVRYAFIHGNWALANGRPDGRNCGVDDELVVLFETGCYADFTFPSAPDEPQPNVVNRIYWPDGDLRRAVVNGLDLQTLTVADVMTRKPRVIGPDKLTAEAVEMMDSRKINQLPVVDEDGRLIGALNMHDLFQAKAI